MSWDELQIFLAVARSGNLQSAAEALAIDRSTVSRRLSTLEKWLGAPLFSRTRTGLLLTSAGKRAFPRASTMESEARALVAEAESVQQISGTVKLAVTEALAPFLVEAGLLEVMEQHPRLHLEILSGNRKVDLAGGEADLALRMDPLKGATLRARCINRSAIALFASPTYLGKRGHPLVPRALKGHEVLLPCGELANLPEAKWLRAQAVESRFTSNSLPALVSAARAGKGIVALTSSWGAREPALEKLFELPGLPPRAMWLVSSAHTSRRPAVLAVTTHLMALLGR